MRQVVSLVLAATMLCLIVLPVYSVSTSVSRCAAIAANLLERADPLDRTPPPGVVAAIATWVGLENLSASLSIALLDRFGCGGSGFANTDWLLNRPALAWQLERTFTQAQIVALFSATADMQRGLIGFSAGAKHYYSKPLDQLEEGEVLSLVQCSTGRPMQTWSYPARPGRPPPIPSALSCPTRWVFPWVE